MGEQVGVLVERRLLGSARDANVPLLAPLAALASVEETCVREKAVDSFCALVRGLDAAAVAEHVVPRLQQLAQAEWFPNRVSVCGLYATAYQRLGGAGAGGGEAVAEAKRQLRTQFATLCGDDTPMVRRAAAKNIGALVPVVEREFVRGELFPLFRALAGDDPDSVRLLAIENGCTAFAKVFTPAENADVLQLVQSCVGDKSWRVRNNVARDFFPLSEAMGADAARGELLPLFVRLLQDPEGEVRASAARNLAGVVSLVGTELFVADVLPVVRELVGVPRDGGALGVGSAGGGDATQTVRAALAEALVGVMAAAGAGAAGEAAVAPLHAAVLPLILQFLRDDAPDVRLRVLDGLGSVVRGAGAKFLQDSVLPVLYVLSGDALWRVREKVLLQMPLLAESLGAQLFESRLLDLYLGTYGDQVNAVRMAATRQLEPLAQKLGAAWVRSRIVPRLLSLYHAEGSSYLQRITVLYAVRNLSVRAAPAGGAGGAAAASVDLHDVAEDLLPLLLEAPRDPVPNVRFVSLQVLAEAVRSGAYDRGTVAARIDPAIQACALSDPDSDVKFFAGEALRRD